VYVVLHCDWEARADRAFKRRSSPTPENGGYVKYPYGAPQRGIARKSETATRAATPSRSELTA
jgi:hypothetical protein